VVSTPRVLVVFYSQSGQLASVVEHVTAPLKARGIPVTEQPIAPRPPYPFPWSLVEFMDVFPESAQMVPPEIDAFGFDPGGHYDLVILAYTVWYLSPSPPMTAFLKSREAGILLKNRPVATVIACRNMWLSAHRKTRRLVEERGGRFCGNLVLTDRGGQWSSLFTTPRWMFTGKKDPWLGIFPEAGILREAIRGARRFGESMARVLESGPPGADAVFWKNEGAVSVNERYLLAEMAGNVLFSALARPMRSIGPPGSPARRIVARIFFPVLILLILTVIPFTLLAGLIARPFNRKWMSAKRRELAWPASP
jgi:hypothetical protein